MAVPTYISAIPSLQERYPGLPQRIGTIAFNKRIEAGSPIDPSHLQHARNIVTLLTGINDKDPTIIMPEVVESARLRVHTITAAHAHSQFGPADDILEVLLEKIKEITNKLIDLYNRTTGMTQKMNDVDTGMAAMNTCIANIIHSLGSGYAEQRIFQPTTMDPPGSGAIDCTGHGTNKTRGPEEVVFQPMSIQPSAEHTIFIPPVTGERIKNGDGGTVTNLAARVPPATSQYVSPPINAQGQRICRQCGRPGRYKAGKCVEKWAPGPMGPGTVCDRCHKKMKRVKQRGNLEAANSLNSINTLQQPQQTRPIPLANLLQPQSGIVHQTDTFINTLTRQARDESDALVAAVSDSGMGGRNHHSNNPSHHATSVALVATHPPAAHSSHLAIINNANAEKSHLPTPPPIIPSTNDELPASNVGRGVSGGTTSIARIRGNEGQAPAQKQCVAI